MLFFLSVPCILRRITHPSFVSLYPYLIHFLFLIKKNKNRDAREVQIF